MNEGIVFVFFTFGLICYLKSQSTAHVKAWLIGQLT